MTHLPNPDLDTRTRILFLNHVSTIGGAERSLLDIVKTLDTSLFAATVCIPPGGNLASEIEEKHARVVLLPMRRFVKSRNPMTLLSCLVNLIAVSRQLKELIVREKIDIVHSNSTTAHLYGGLAARMAGKSCIWHCRDLVQLGLPGRLMSASATVIVAISQAVADELSKYGHPGKVRVIRNGINLETFTRQGRRHEIRKELGIERESPVIAMAAQMTPWKNHSLFLHAANLVSSSLPGARFLVSGASMFGENPAYEQQLRQLTKDLRLEQSVVFTGHREDFRDVLDAVDVFVHPAAMEPFGRVVAEAMASSKPVVAVRSGGIPELIADGHTGLLVSPDSAEEMARAIVSIVNDPDLASGLGKNARQFVSEQFRIELLSKALEKLYIQLAHPTSTNSSKTDSFEAKEPVAYVLGEFPSLSETFILREIMALEKLGLNIRLYSLNRSSSSKVHAQAKAMLHGVHFPAPLLSLCMMRSKCSRFFAKPGVYLAMAFQAMAHGPRSFRNFLIATQFADDAYRAGVKHIHAHFAFMPTDVGILMARLLGLRFSFSAHARDIYTQDPSLLARKIREASFVVTCTEHGRKHLKKIAPELVEERIELVHHGVDASTFTPGTSSKRAILAVGRLEEKKGFSDLIKACGIMTLSGVDFSCTIVGAGLLESELEEEILRSGAAGSVILFGEATQEELLELYGQAQLLIVPSVLTADGDRDGIPNVLLEAMAMKLPIVATTTGAIKEAVTDGENGMLVPPGDPKALASAILRLLENAEARKKLGENGRQRVERQFDLGKNAAQMLALLKAHAMKSAEAA